MKSIFVSAGHSDVDPGAVANGRREADIAVEFRNMVAFYLQREGIRIGLDGAGTQNLPLNKAAAQAKHFDIAVEFHCNAASASATGAETLSGPKDMALGESIAQAIAGALGIRNRGAKPENSGQHSRLAFVQAGGIIVEILFITNTFDLRAYDARKWVAAKAVADVLIDKAKQA
jgi:N-acetylmuramoyl-L-alanine amidase